MFCKSIIKALLFALVLTRVGVVFAQAPSVSYPAGTHNYTTGSSIIPLGPANAGGPVPPNIYGQVTTFVGDGNTGSADGIGTAASLSGPVSIAFDAAGNLYVTDYYLLRLTYYNNMIRKVTPAGMVTTLAGNTGGQGATNGQGAAASFFSPNGVAVDANGNVFVADVGNNLIRKITPAGLVTTFAGIAGVSGTVNGPAATATFFTPSGIAIDGAGNLYVGDYSNSLIRKITAAGVVSTLAGGGGGTLQDGTGANATFGSPEGVAVDINGNVIVADVKNNAIRKVTPAGVVTTIAGNGTSGSKDGTGAAATFNRPTGVSVDIGGNIYVADAGNTLIRKITPAGVVSTLAGNGTNGATNGIGTAATFNDPEGLGVDNIGNLYIGDKGNNLVRKIAVTGYSISPALPTGLNFDGTSGIISGNPATPSPATKYTVTAYNLSGSSTTTVTISVTGNIIVRVKPPVITYTTPQLYKVNLTIAPLSPANTGGAVPAASYGGTTIFAGSGIPGATNNTGALATFNSPGGTAVDAAGNIYVADEGNNIIRKITPSGVVTTLAGSGAAGSSNGNGTSASFNNPTSLTVDGSGNVYVADAGNNAIREITPGGQVTTFATGFSAPYGVVADAQGNLYVTDQANNLIKKVSPAGAVSVFAGSGANGAIDGQGTAASFSQPTGIAIDAAGYLYITDSGDNRVRRITPGGLVTTLAGSGASGSADGTGPAASFKSPSGIAVDGIGNVYVSDSGNDVIRKITPNGVVTTLAGLAGNIGRSNGQGAAARFNNPKGLSIDANGNLYVGDQVNNIIRQVSTTGYMISMPLPPGLNFDSTTGIISGTPTAPSPATNYTITAYNLGGSSSYTVNITVQNPIIIVIPPPSISYVTPQNYVINTTIIPLGPANTGGAVPPNIYGQVSTFAGSGSSGAVNGTGTAASFSSVHNVASDLVSNLYVTDNNIIRKITPSGVVTTLAGSAAAGSADGQGAAASFNQPLGITVDNTGTIYVADTKNNTIRMITQAGVVTTFAGTPGAAGNVNGTGAAARFNAPSGVAVDQNGNLYVADAGNRLIRKITPAGVVTTFSAGGGPGGGSGAFNKPVGIAVDLNGNVYVADQVSNSIYKISPAGVLTTFAGNGAAGSVNGTGTAATFNGPAGVSVDPYGNVYVADQGNNLIRKISPAGVVTTLAGSGAAGAVNGALTSASFNRPDGLSADISGDVFVADFNNFLVRKIVTTGYVIDKPLPAGLTFDGKTGLITGTPRVLSPTTIYTVTAYNIGGSSSTQISITVSDKQAPPVPEPDISYNPGVDVYTVNITITPLVPTNTGGILPNKVFGKTTTLAGTGSPGAADGTGTSASFNQPFGVATDPKGNIYVVDHSNNIIRKITPGGVVTTFAGSGQIGNADGTGTAASFNQPTGIAIDAAGNVYVADVSNNLIRKITPAGVVTTLAGSGALGAADGTGVNATFSNPSGVAVDAAGNVYVADLSNNRIRKITPGGVVTTIAGSGLSGSADGIGTGATFNQPYGVAVDQQGNVYVADWGNNLIRKITPAGVVTTIAGSGKPGYADGQGTAASFNKPFGLSIDGNGNIYVTDTGNERIRKISPDGNVTTVAGNGEKGAVNGDNGTSSSFYQPTGIVSDGAGNVFIADEFNHLIREVVTVSNYTIDKPLPPGLMFDNTTGTISGNPTAASPSTDYTVTAYNQGGSSSYILNITVKGLQQVITFTDISKTYGDPDFPAGATSNNTTIPLTYTSSDPAIATVNTNGVLHITGAGTTNVTVSQAGNDSYIAATPVTKVLTVGKATITITADDKSKIYGTPNPSLTFTTSPFAYSETLADLLTQPVAATLATTSSPVGTYPIDIIGGTSDNYIIIPVSGVLTITPAPEKIVIPNTFTPNGDGVNDLWNIKALDQYPNCLVSIYTRWGALIFQSKGYPKPWDGTYNGREVPVGTYYYIIDTQTAIQKLAGFITVLR